MVLGAMGAAGMMQPTIRRASESTVQASISKRQLSRIYSGIEFGYPNGPGWSNRHVKRIAGKVRNIKRNRLAHKGK